MEHSNEEIKDVAAASASSHLLLCLLIMIIDLDYHDFINTFVFGFVVFCFIIRLFLVERFGTHNLLLEGKGSINIIVISEYKENEWYHNLSTVWGR